MSREMKDIRCGVVGSLTECTYATLGNGYFGCKCKASCSHKRPQQAPTIDELEKEIESYQEMKRCNWGNLKKINQLEEKVKKIIQEYADLLHDSECLYEQCENKTHMRASVKEYYHAENEFLTTIKGES